MISILILFFGLLGFILGFIMYRMYRGSLVKKGRLVEHKGYCNPINQKRITKKEAEEISNAIIRILKINLNL